MKTVLFIDSSGSRYFQRTSGQWRPVDGPTSKDTLWVLVNLPDESLEVIDLPRLYGSDRLSFLERRLAAAFPESNCRAAHTLSGGLLAPGKVMLTGLSSAEETTAQLADLDTHVVGLWGAAALLTMMAKGVGSAGALVVLPSPQAMRILVLKEGVPVLTRYVHSDASSNADEILLTHHYLENQRIFTRGKPPPVLFLGDAAAVEARLGSAGLNLLPVPKGLLPKGEAGWLHPFFEKLVSSPPCQLAPLPLRARYVVRNVRWAAYAGAVLSLCAGGYFGQGEIRDVMVLRERVEALQIEEQGAGAERERLVGLIAKSGADPELVRRATQFEAQEITAAPSQEAFLPLAAAIIAEVPAARVQTLSFRLAANGEAVCQAKGELSTGSNPVEEAPSVDGSGEVTAGGLRLAEVQLTVALPEDLSPRARSEARQRISQAVQAVAGVKLLQDPVLAARKAVLSGGLGANSGLAEDRWCLSVPWQPTETTPSAATEGGAL